MIEFREVGRICAIIISMNKIFDDPILVDRPQVFEQMMQDLSRQKFLAVDTESNSLYVYQEQVCLIQFSTEKVDYLVDPISLKDISPLGDLFANPDIEKIFHAAEYDLICLKRDYQFKFSNLFDTMLAGRILGRDAVGLSSMVEEAFGITLDKRYQKANWGKRPLPEEYIDYARLDTHYLLDLRNKLKDEIIKADLWALAQEDFERQCQVEIPVIESGVNLCWRIAGNQYLNDKQMAVLQSLCVARDNKAKSKNVPPFKVIGNQSLLQIALEVPNSMADLQCIQALSYRTIQQHGKWLLEAVQLGMNNKPIARSNNNHRPDDSILARIDRLRNWRKETAKGLGVSSDVVLPRDILQKIAFENPQNLDELKPIMETLPWRFSHFGRKILAQL